MSQRANLDRLHLVYINSIRLADAVVYTDRLANGGMLICIQSDRLALLLGGNRFRITKAGYDDHDSSIEAFRSVMEHSTTLQKLATIE